MKRRFILLVALLLVTAATACERIVILSHLDGGDLDTGSGDGSGSDSGAFDGNTLDTQSGGDGGGITATDELTAPAR